MRLIRAILGSVILVLDRLTTPEALVRTPERQAEVDRETRKLTLYQFVACPFCVKVRRQIKRLGLNIALKDVQKDAQAEKELMEGGKEYQVPCLRIESDAGVRWMYESSDINAYLAERFSA